MVEIAATLFVVIVNGLTVLGMVGIGIANVFVMFEEGGWRS